MSFKPTDDFVNYVTNADNVWNPERYLENRRVNGVTDGYEYSFKYTYTIGNAYMTGQIGQVKVEVYYQYLQGFQVYIRLDGELIKQESFVPHKVEEVKELLAFYATNGN